MSVCPNKQAEDYGCWLMYRGELYGKTGKALLFECDTKKHDKEYLVILLIY